MFVVPPSIFILEPSPEIVTVFPTAPPPGPFEYIPTFCPVVPASNFMSTAWVTLISELSAYIPVPSFTAPLLLYVFSFPLKSIFFPFVAYNPIFPLPASSPPTVVKAEPPIVISPV